jgi:ABC-type nitrate/sulfonate/bicarbonate transport system substrate-binding protein
MFAKRGLNVEPVLIISANDAANAVVRGDVVANATVPLNVLLNIEENEPGTMRIFMVKATSTSQWSDYLLVRSGSELASIGELAGMKVGGYPGSAQQTLLKLILGKFMAKDQIVTIELPPSTQLQALDQGQVAALITYDALAQVALDEGIAQVLEENPICKHIVDPLYGFPYVLSTDLLVRDRDTALKIRDAFYEAVQYMHDHDTEAREIMSKWTNTKPEVASKVRLWDQVVEERIDRAELQHLADIYYENGVTQKRIDTQSLYLEDWLQRH